MYEIFTSSTKNNNYSLLFTYYELLNNFLLAHFVAGITKLL
jgi:hypothetical protein